MKTEPILFLVTLDTKTLEAEHLRKAIERYGFDVRYIDISLDRDNSALHGHEKIDLMNRVADDCLPEVSDLIEKGTRLVMGMGGGTGSQIVLKIFKKLPLNFPKLLITTLPFDPRNAVADNNIILIPTPYDIQGMNPLLDETFERVAALTNGILSSKGANESRELKKNIAISALGVTNKGVIEIQSQLAGGDYNTIIFHSNGYGGAALVRAVDEEIVHGLIDFTPHELTRMRLAGAHVDMDRRFTAAVEKDLPMIIVPGGLNFVGLGAFEELEEAYRRRPVFRHSELFTHVAVLPEEMESQTEYLMSCLANGPSEIQVLVPMQGFSNTDREGQELFSPELRQIFVDSARKFAGPNIRITEFPEFHIEDAGFAKICAETLLEYLN